MVAGAIILKYRIVYVRSHIRLARGAEPMATSGPIDFLIITALEEERDAVLQHSPGYQQLPPTEHDVRVYYEATIQANQAGGTSFTYSIIVVCLSSMGRVQATATASDAIRHWKPNYVILVGIAGGLKSAGIALGDILIAEQIADYEVQKIEAKKTEIRWTVHPVDHRLLEFSRSLPVAIWQAEIREKRPNNDEGVPKRHQGTIVTGDKVITVNALLESFKNQNWPKLIGVEMEAGGAAVAAHQSPHRPGFFMVRCVSDQAGNKGKKAVKVWRSYACDAAAAYAITLLRSGPVLPNRETHAAVGQHDDLATEMAKLTFGELEAVTNYVVEQSAQPGVDFRLLDPREKMERNGLTARTHDQLVLGLSKVQLVTDYVEHIAKLDNRFPDKLTAGFLAAYRRLSEEGLERDDLFDHLAEFACRYDHRTRYRAAGLAVLTYLFEKCDVFER
jgi:nucleoside phosphorylase